jgi:hypothetical protein
VQGGSLIKFRGSLHRLRGLDLAGPEPEPEAVARGQGLGVSPKLKIFQSTPAARSPERFF